MIFSASGYVYCCFLARTFFWVLISAFCSRSMFSVSRSTPLQTILYSWCVLARNLSCFSASCTHIFVQEACSPLVFQWSRTCPWRCFSFCWFFWQGCSSCLAHPVQYLFKNQYCSLVFQCTSRVPLQFLRLGRTSVVHHLLLSVLSTSPFCFSLTFLRIYFCFLHQFFKKSKPHYSPGVLIRFPFSRSTWFLIDSSLAVSRGQFVISIIWLPSPPGKIQGLCILFSLAGLRFLSFWC